MLRIAQCAARFAASLLLLVGLSLAAMNAVEAASFNKFNLFTDDAAQAELELNTDTIKVMLTDTLPVATNHKYSDISADELASGDGYTTGGATVSGTGCTNSSGTETCTASPTTWTSVTGSMGPFEYVVYYDYTSTNKTLIGWYSNGSAVTLNGANGDTYTVTPAGGDFITLAQLDLGILLAANDNRLLVDWMRKAS
ncbi:MAG: hypothetical protein ACRELF_10790 [Gemmataceae bacterium]